MLELGSFDDARRKVLADAQRTLAGIKRVVAEPTDSIDATMAVLSTVRRQAQEYLNQIQHEQMIIGAAEWLVRHGVAGVPLRWLWNPRQSGDRSGPDLVGLEGDATRVCAEVGAQEDAVGVVDAQMRRALAKLTEMEGRRFYFVRTASMKRRAVTKIVKAGWDIAVVQIALQPDLPGFIQGVPLTSLAATRGADAR
jgi:hypothetical protein